MDPADQQRLRTLADLDKRLSQLEHQRVSLPQLAAIDAAQRELSGVSDRLVDAQTRRNDLAREMSRLEADIDGVRARHDRNQQRINSGAVAHAKDLTALEHENETLQRRQGVLEDQELELMEQAEQLDADLAEIQREIDRVEEGRTAAEAERDAAWAQIDQQIADLNPQRSTVVSSIPADVRAVYDKVRSTGTPGAALLSQRRCGGCRMELSGSELAAVRSAAPSDIVRCESCRGILVRTAESGL